MLHILWSLTEHDKKVTLALTILNENSIVPLQITKVHPDRGNFNYIWKSPPVEEHPPNLIENFYLKQFLVDSRDQTPDLNHSLQLNHLARGISAINEAYPGLGLSCFRSIARELRPGISFIGTDVKTRWCWHYMYQFWAFIEAPIERLMGKHWDKIKQT